METSAMIKSIYHILLLISLLIMPSCKEHQQSAQDKAFLKMFPSMEMNTKIQLWEPSHLPEQPRIGKILDLTLENFSKDKIRFPGDYGIKIYSYNNISNSWEVIGNDITYFPLGNPQVSPKGTDFPGIIGISAVPMIVNEGKPVDIRVIVIGSVVRDGTPTSEQVGAYVDLTLQP
jgi:hypothetical protein